MRRLAPYLALLLFVVAGCGGNEIDGSIDAALDDSIPDLFVARIYPSAGDVDPVTGDHFPTFTDPNLVSNSGPSGVGAIAIHFQPAGKLDFLGLFIGRDPQFGLDVSKIHVGWYEDGQGLFPLDYTSVELVTEGGEDIVRLVPEVLPLATLQYQVVVGTLVLDTSGAPIADFAYQSFFVGGPDDEGPLYRWSEPFDTETDVPAGLDSGPVSVYFSEAVDVASVTPDSFYVYDISGPSPVLVPPAPGFPKLTSQDDGSVFPSNGHGITWRAANGLPYGAALRVTVEGQDIPTSGMGAIDLHWIFDLAGNPLAKSKVLIFQTQGAP